MCFTDLVISQELEIFIVGFQPNPPPPKPCSVNLCSQAMFTRDRFQMVPFQKSCRIGLLFTRDLLTVPSIRSRSGPKTGPPKKQVQFLEPFRSQTDPSPCKHPDRFLLADPSPCKHLDRFLLALRRHFESYNVCSAHA